VTILIVCLVIDVIVVTLRSSLANARLPQLVSLRDLGSVRVERTIRLLENPRLRPTLRLLVVSMHFLVAGSVYLVWRYLRPDLDSLGSMLIVLFLSAVVLLALEFVIEGRIIPRAERTAIRMTPLANAINILFTPLSSLLMVFLGSTPAAPVTIPVTEDELKNWVEEDQPQSSLEQGERRMIYSIFQFGETLCREVMVPRIDVLALDINTPLEEAIQSFTRSGHSRVPVYEETIDNVIGVLYAKDMLKVRLDGQTLYGLRDLLRAAYFVPEAKKVEELLAEMRANGVHIAIVVDEYGGMAGLVTLEDIVEEIVGEIRDEYDQIEELPYTKVGEDEYVFQGRIDLEDVNDISGMHLAKDVADTLGGYISAQVGHVPQGGEELQINDWKLTVEQVSGRRIRKVRARRQVALSEVEENGNDHER
jgi:CBS domain containing-hemolysin-like protein